VRRKLIARASCGNRADLNKDLLSRNCMSEKRPCSATDRHGGSDWGWKSSSTTEVFGVQSFISY